MIKRSIDTCERFLARVWPFLLAAAVCGALVSCATSHIVTDEDGNEILVTMGENILPGVADTISDVVGIQVEDVVGAAGEAISQVDVPEIVDDVSSGNWLAAALGVLGVGVAVATGVRLRRKLRQKK